MRHILFFLHSRVFMSIFTACLTTCINLIEMKTKHTMGMRAKYLLPYIFCLIAMAGCKDDNDHELPQGNYTHAAVNKLQGFGEEKAGLLAGLAVDEETFIRLSTTSAWTLQPTEQTTLKNIRNGVSKPDEVTLLQKILPLEDMPIYMENVYGGTIGGFVAEAADVKSLTRMYDVYWGLRLDYEGTKFSENGAGYAVIRYYSNTATKLIIPFSPELGGTQPHAWPNGGGGFTTSTLGEGGYPEWVSDGYNAPVEGAELYEVTAQGQEQLRSVFRNGKWQTYGASGLEATTKTKTETSATIRNGMHDGKLITTWCRYAGYPFIVRGEVDGKYHLTTTRKVPVDGLRVIEKGIYGLQVSKDAVENVHEEAKKL